MKVVSAAGTLPEYPQSLELFTRTVISFSSYGIVGPFLLKAMLCNTGPFFWSSLKVVQLLQIFMTKEIFDLYIIAGVVSVRLHFKGQVSDTFSMFTCTT